MRNGVCVGGTVLANNRMVRLLSSTGSAQPTNTPFEIGQIWEITFANRTIITPPHIEDVVIQTANPIGNIENINQYIIDNGLVNWTGNIENVFDGLLSWTGAGSGFIPVGGQYPNKTTGFWVPDIDLSRIQFDDNIKYRYKSEIIRQAKFVGHQESVNILPAGTIVRVSLSRRYNSYGNDGFWLQLSGWY